MTRVAILEANTPDIVDGRRLAGVPTAAECYDIAFRDVGVEVDTAILEPYRQGLGTAELDGFDAAIFTGSGVAWSVDATEGRVYLEACQKVFDFGLPVFGSCNGLQMAAVLLGGSIRYNENGLEVGLAKGLHLTEHGQSHPMFEGRTDGYAVPCIHRDEVDRLPHGAQLLARNDHTLVQAFAYVGNGVDFWGTQYHPEYTAGIIGQFLESRLEVFDTDRNALVADLFSLEQNDDIAARHCSTVEAQRAPTRTLELQNWLKHIQS